MQGIEFTVLKRKGKCQHCANELLSGTKTVVLGSYTNLYRYCVPCFLKTIENEFNVEILDFMKEK